MFRKTESITRSDPGFGVYIHWPFCASKCPYCDFNSHVAETIDHQAGLDAYLAELARAAEETKTHSVDTVFFGGGTPSLMRPETVSAILDAVAGLWEVAGDVEITLEANPTSTEAGKFRALEAAGVNRLSLGVQSFRDEALDFLGREHDVREAQKAIETAASVFSRYSFDLIYARPDQTVAQWKQELVDALSLAGGHLSVYQLTIEPGTAFHRDRIPPAGEDIGADLYDVTQEILTGAGLPAYEISNHARAGEECRHNLIYWRSGNYVGIGPGAHGRLHSADGTDHTVIATYAERMPDDWLSAVRETGSGECKRYMLTGEERVEEILLMGLRLTRGIEADHFRARTGRALCDVLNTEAVRILQDEGLITFDARRLCATAEGRKRLDSVLAALLG